jgi:hypothetical protein
MPDIGASSLSIAFGDFRRGYLVVDRAGVRVLRDPYSAKPYVLFYTTKRVGGGVQDIGSVNRKIPGEFYGSTIGKVIAEADLGDGRAKTCVKLLSRDDYRKPGKR